MKTISIQLPDALGEFIEREAKSQLTTRAGFVRQLLLAYCKEKCPEALTEPNQQSLALAAKEVAA